MKEPNLRHADLKKSDFKRADLPRLDDINMLVVDDSEGMQRLIGSMTMIWFIVIRMAVATAVAGVFGAVVAALAYADFPGNQEIVFAVSLAVVIATDQRRRLAHSSAAEVIGRPRDRGRPPGRRWSGPGARR